MIPLLFLNPRWIKENPVAALLVAVIFISIGMALHNWWQKQQSPKANSG